MPNPTRVETLQIPVPQTVMQSCETPDSFPIEVLRVWVVDGNLHLGMRTSGDADQWGTILADILKHVVNVHMQLGQGRAEVEKAILDTFHNEMANSSKQIISKQELLE